MLDDGLDLSDCTANGTMKGVLKNDLNLVWALIKKYELPAVEDDLLKWAKPRAASLGFKQVANFDQDWQNGEAFLGLVDAVVAERKTTNRVDRAKLGPNPTEFDKLRAAFAIALSELGAFLTSCAL